MKFCEKCGNKIKDGYLFCDKCGTKVKETEEAVKEKKKEKRKEVKKEVETVEASFASAPIISPKKKGKGKIVLLIILNVLLLGAAITFMLLWLTKSTDCEKTCPKCEEKIDPVPEPKKTKSHIGRWEQNIEYKRDNKVTKRTYGLIELKEDGSFYSLYYDKDSISSTKEEIKGTYTVKNNIVKFSYVDGGSKETMELTLDNDKLCLNDNCDNYLTKDGNNKITIDEEYFNKNDIKYITYNEYEKLQKNYEDAIVVVVKKGCSACENFETVVKRIDNYYSTSVYYYEYDGKISVNVTPTTLIIKNGYVVDSVEGYKDYISMVDILDELDIE